MSTKTFQMILAIVSIILFFSCSSVKKANKFMDKAFNADSQTAVKRLRQAFPCKIDTESVFFFGSDSSDFFKLKSDSLLKIKQHVKDSIAIIYKDSCRSIQENYAQGFNLGYQVGIFDGRRHAVHDTLKITQHIKDSAEVYDMQKTVTSQAATIESLKKKNEKKLHWIFGIALGLAISVILNILQFKSKIL
jgi:flagellar biosynthesis/type III secretory pathway protein FliH